MKECYNVKGMSCAICKNTIEKNLNKLDGVKSCEINLLDNEMHIEYDDNKININTIKDKVDNLGYELILDNNKKTDIKDIKLIISIILMLILMYLAMGHMFSLPMLINDHNLSNIMQLFIASIIYILNIHFFISGFKSLFHLNPNMDALVSISTASAYLYSIYAIIKIINGNHSFHLYFETGAMILVIVAIGKFIEDKNKHKTTKALRALALLRPMNARVIENGEYVTKDINDIKLGDILEIRPYENIPMDGILLEGNTYVNESMITGESDLVFKKINDHLIGGTINQAGLVKIKVDKEIKDSILNKIIELTKEATTKKIKIQRIADKISNYFVPFVIITALLTFIIWYFISSDFELSMNFGLSVLVISCPCALGLATPSAIMVASGVSANNGILIRNPETLESLKDIKTIILDKTGTITQNKASVVKYDEYDIEFKDILISLESNSNHPLAKTILSSIEGKVINFDHFEEIMGEGIVAYIDKHRYLAGNLKLLNRYDIKLESRILDGLAYVPYSYVIVVKDDKLLGIIYLSDTIKSDANKAIAKLNMRHIKTIMCTGDNEKVASKVAKEVGIKEYIASASPSDKYDTIKKYKEQGLVAMVGDGINDAAALSFSDISFAISNGSDIAYESSDLILINNDINDIDFMIELSKTTMRIIKQNLFWALFYNAIFIPVAAGLFYPHIVLNPMLGAFSMSISSIIVLSNALRIYKVHKKEEKVMERKIKIEGMMCQHCVSHVKDALAKLGLESEVSLENKEAIIKGNASDSLIKEAIKDAGYEVIDIYASK